MTSLRLEVGEMLTNAYTGEVVPVLGVSDGAFVVPGRENRNGRRSADQEWDSRTLGVDWLREFSNTEEEEQ